MKGDFCKPCECNGNIDKTDPGACDSVTGLCQLCLYDTEGDNCEKCKNWWYGDAIEAKNCKGIFTLIFSCPITIKSLGCQIFNFNIFSSIIECECNKEGSLSCDHLTGTCECKPGVTGQLCDRCEVDYFDFGNPDGCQPCNCRLVLIYLSFTYLLIYSTFLVKPMPPISKGIYCEHIFNKLLAPRSSLVNVT